MPSRRGPAVVYFNLESSPEVSKRLIAGCEKAGLETVAIVAGRRAPVVAAHRRRAR